MHPAGAASPDELMQRLVYAIFVTQERELSCAEVYEMLDQYADLDLAGIDVAATLPQVRFHLELCTECAEAYIALHQLLLAA